MGVKYFQRIPENIVQLIKYGFSLNPFFNHEFMEKQGVKLYFDSKRFQLLCNKFVKKQKLGNRKILKKKHKKYKDFSKLGAIF